MVTWQSTLPGSTANKQWGFGCAVGSHTPAFDKAGVMSVKSLQKTATIDLSIYLKKTILQIYFIYNANDIFHVFYSVHSMIIIL